MEAARRSEVASSLRWLAAPPSLLALVVLLLNDRVLKDQWAGLLTGKLSDVAGLVVAPPLVALLLAALRVPRTRAWAVGVTGVLFALAKGLAAGSAVASAVWSLAMPSLVRHDPTDLVALPALWVAWRTGAWAADSAAANGRRRSALAVGTLVLPCAVFATTATSCSPMEGLRDVTVYEGVFTGGDGTLEQRIVTGDWSRVTIDGAGRLQRLASLDRDRMAEHHAARTTQTCSTRTTQKCWRRAPEATAAIEASTDGGATWQTEFTVPRSELAATREDVGDDTCGSEPPLGVADLAILDAPQGQVVAVASSNTGLLLRGVQGDWRRVTLEDLHRTADPEPTPDPAVQLFPVEPVPTTTTTPPVPGPTRPTGPRGTSGPAPSPTCATPVTRTYTPDPRNGPPVTVTRCP